MLKSFAFAIALLISPIVLAELSVKIRGEPLTITWTAPTEYVNGNPLSIEELSHFTIYWECDTGKNGMINHISNLATTMQVPTENSLLGNCELAMTASVHNGLESVKYNSLLVLIKLPSPSYGGFR